MADNCVYPTSRNEFGVGANDMSSTAPLDSTSRNLSTHLFWLFLGSLFKKKRINIDIYIHSACMCI